MDRWSTRVSKFDYLCFNEIFIFIDIVLVFLIFSVVICNLFENLFGLLFMGLISFVNFSSKEKRTQYFA